jgi:hypothetical protein
MKEKNLSFFLEKITLDNIQATLQWLVVSFY